MGYGAWDMGHGLWVMGHGLRGMGYGPWVMGMGHGSWVIGQFSAMSDNTKSAILSKHYIQYKVRRHLSACLISSSLTFHNSTVHYTTAPSLI